jgi:hypothetical protein
MAAAKLGYAFSFQRSSASKVGHTIVLAGNRLCTMLLNGELQVDMLIKQICVCMQ